MSEIQDVAVDIVSLYNEICSRLGIKDITSDIKPAIMEVAGLIVESRTKNGRYKKID